MNNIPTDIKSLLVNAYEALRQNNFSKGKTLLEKVLLVNPNIFEVNFNLGIIYLRTNKLDDSLICLQKAKKLKPNSPEVYFNLGVVFDKKKEYALSIENFTKNINLNPSNYVAYYNIGSLYQEIFEIKKAEKYLIKTIDLKPEYSAAYNNLFDLYDRSNQLDKYSNLLEKAQKYIKQKSLMDFYLGVHQYKKKNYQHAINILENINFNEENITQNIKRFGILAKSYDQISKFEKAFNNFKINNDLVGKHEGKYIDNQVYITYIKQRIEYFQNFKISDWKNYPFKINSIDPIFLIGFPRSGTTLLDTILRTNKTIDVIEEKPILRNFLIKLEKKTKNDFNQLKDLDLEFIEEMRSFYFEEREKYLNKKTKIVIDKMPLNIIHIGEILRFFPNAKFIFALRHPYDSVLSCFMQYFSLNPAMKNFLSIDNSAMTYDLVMKLWLIYKKKFKINFHFIKYEDVVLNFEKTTKDMFKFLDVDWSDETKNFYLTAKNRKDIVTPSYNQVTSPLYLKSISRWKNYKKNFVRAKNYLDKWVNEFDY